jgi:hypothetical protein
VLGLGDDEAAADGVEDLRCEWCRAGIEGGEAHAVGVRGLSGDGVHLVAMEAQVLLPGERDGALAEQVDRAGGRDAVQCSLDCRGIDLIGSLSEQAEQDGAVGAVTDAGESERAVELHSDASGAVELASRLQILGETKCGAHGADSMGAGGADPNLEKFEEAGVHKLILSAAAWALAPGRS